MSTSAHLENLRQMPPHHFDDLQSIASDHWWYLSRLEWARSHVNELLKLHPAAKVFDIGAGVGSFSENLYQTARINVTNIENDPYACALIRSKGLRLIEHDISKSFDALPEEFTQGPCIYVFLDVLEHLADPKETLRSLAKSSGENHCIITVPAMRFLYSQWDRELGHFTRFDKRSFAALVEGTGWMIESLRYFFSFAVLPAFVFRRLLTPLRPMKRIVIPRATPVGNVLWRRLYSFEKRLNQRRLGPPCGTSLMAVLRKS